MKNLLLLIIAFLSLEDWIYALVVTTQLNTKWEIALLLCGLGKTIIIQGVYLFIFSNLRKWF